MSQHPDATLPSSNFLNPDLPLVPIAIKSMFSLSAKFTMPPTIVTENIISVFICILSSWP